MYLKCCSCIVTFCHVVITVGHIIVLYHSTVGVVNYNVSETFGKLLKIGIIKIIYTENFIYEFSASIIIHVIYFIHV